MGETQEGPFQLSFNRSVRVEFQGSRVTSDGGLLLVRELDERLGFGELIERHLVDGRGKNSQLPLAELVRQSIYSRLAGYEDVNDAERLAEDPAFRLIGCEKVVERGGALSSRLQSFEAELLTRPENLAGLATVNRELLAKARALAPRRRAGRSPLRKGEGQGVRSDEAPTVAPGATTLDRVHIAMLLQASGQANALRTMLKAEQDRGPDFLRLANALSALYPRDSEEKRLLDAMLMAVPR